MLEKKIIIIPWTDKTMQMKQYLNLKYEIFEECILDGECFKYNHKIKPIEYIKELKNDSDVLFLVDDTYGNISVILEKYGVNSDRFFIMSGDPLTAQDALIKCCNDESIKTVLDVGCGKGNHSNIFLEFGKEVTGIDAGFSERLRKDSRFKLINADFENINIKEQYDLVWCAHVLEHQLNVGGFINKLFECCKDTGKVAITVPNQTDMRVVAGHVSVWNAGLLIYNIIMSGYSCKNAMIKTYAGNVSVIVPKEKIMLNNDYRIANQARKEFPPGLDLGIRGLVVLILMEISLN